MPEDGPTFHPPEEISGRLVCLRRYRASDAAAVKQAIAESREALIPWMAWAKDPPTDATVAEFLMPASERFGGTGSANYAITLAGVGSYVGGCGLMPRIGAGALEIGYWVRSSHHRKGIATETARLLAAAALALPGITRVEIHCDEANTGSRSVARAAGFRLDRVDKDEIEAPGEIGRSMIWVATMPAFAPEAKNGPSGR